jgi:hypothetical protein
MNKTLKITEPKTFPAAIELSFATPEATETESSGREVNTEIKINPTASSEIPKKRESFEALSTTRLEDLERMKIKIKSAANSKKTISKKRKKRIKTLYFIEEK